MLISITYCWPMLANFRVKEFVINLKVGEYEHGIGEIIFS